MIADILGRPERHIPVDEPLEKLRGERILVTGAEGSLGKILSPLLLDAAEVWATDIEDLDVRDSKIVDRDFYSFHPSLVFHLAGSKQAPDGEVLPELVTETNIIGTLNVTEQGVRTVLASTCKACEAETVYGATKLVAERLVLNAGGSVARFYNVADTAGNVFEYWASLDKAEPLPVAPCLRYFVSSREAVALLLWAAVLPSGRYTIDPGAPRFMPSVAQSVYPGRQHRAIRPRRGDRVAELLCARSEHLEDTRVDGIRRIVSWHDAAQTDDEMWREWWDESRAAA